LNVLPEQPVLINQILWNRGYKDRDTAFSYLNPTKYKFPSEEFVQLDKAVEYIKLFIDNELHITIWGDFDADGQTSTAVFLDTLRILGHTNVSYHIPSRFDNNHGLNSKEIENIANKYPKSLIITCDCGTNDVEYVRGGSALGLDFIITDHHEQTGPLCEAKVTVNSSIQSLDSNFRGLCGVGVAFVVCRALLKEYKCDAHINDLLDLVAIGTIADVATNTNLNRALLARGLPILWSGRRKGIAAMIKAYDIRTFDCNTEEISFKLGPMLNAAGRMAHASMGVDLLLAETDEIADFYALRLKILNQERQIAMSTLENELESVITSRDDPALIIIGEGWHPGLIGLAAGRLANKYKRPSIVITNKDEEFLRASCRTAEGVHMLNVLETQKHLLHQYGGHAGAAGFIIKRANMEEFMVGFLSVVDQFKKYSSNTLIYDVEISWSDLDTSLTTYSTVAQIESLAPFNEQNPIPKLLSKNLTIQNFKPIGDDKNHAVVTFVDTNGVVNDVYYWRFDKDFGSKYYNKQVDIIYTIERSFFTGRPSVRLTLEGIRLSEG